VLVEEAIPPLPPVLETETLEVPPLWPPTFEEEAAVVPPDRVLELAESPPLLEEKPEETLLLPPVRDEAADD
jgi:hypothetical protein